MSVAEDFFGLAKRGRPMNSGRFCGQKVKPHLTK
jgi:hypothetical protein